MLCNRAFKKLYEFKFKPAKTIVCDILFLQHYTVNSLIQNKNFIVRIVKNSIQCILYLSDHITDMLV